MQPKLSARHSVTSAEPVILGYSTPQYIEELESASFSQQLHRRNTMASLIVDSLWQKRVATQKWQQMVHILKFFVSRLIVSSLYLLSRSLWWSPKQPMHQHTSTTRYQEWKLPIGTIGSSNHCFGSGMPVRVTHVATDTSYEYPISCTSTSI